MSERSVSSRLRVGQRWSGLLGQRRIEWTVTRIWKRKAELRGDVECGTATVTVWIDRMLDNPEWELLA